MARDNETASRTNGASFWPVVYTISTGAFMAALDASIVTVASPTLETYFHARVATVEWVAVAYLVSLSALLVAFGRAADAIGRSRMYQAGFGVFIIGSAACGAAPTIAFLVVSRLFQAAGAALLQANSIAIITAQTPIAQRGRAIGVQGAAQALGLSLGPVVGGLLLGWLGWRWLFYVNVPVGILGTLLALRFLPKDVRGEPQRFDWVGALLATGAIALLLFGLSESSALGWSSPTVTGSLVIPLLLVALLIPWERRHPHPVVDLTLLKNWRYASGNLSGMLSYTLMYGVLFLTPFALEGVMGMAASRVGLFMAAVPVMMTVCAPIAGRLADRGAARRLTAGGMAIGALGAAALALSMPLRSLLLVAFGLSLVGIGMGLFTPPNNATVMGLVPRERLGTAGGFLNMTRSLGMSLGVSMTGAIYAGLLLSRLGTETPTPAQGAVTAGVLAVAYGAVMGASILAVIVSLVRRPGAA